MGIDGAMTKSAVKFTKEQVEALKRIARDAELEGRDVLDQFSDDEIVQSFNGTGASSLPEWERYILTKLTGRKLPAVMIHDMQYRRGGSEEERRKTNRQLARNFLKLHEYDVSKGRVSIAPWWRWASRKAVEVTDRDEAKSGWGVA